MEKYHQYKKGTVYFIVSVFILCLLAGCSSKQEETDLLKGWVGNYAFYDDFQVPDGPYMRRRVNIMQIWMPVGRLQIIIYVQKCTGMMNGSVWYLTKN